MSLQMNAVAFWTDLQMLSKTSVNTIHDNGRLFIECDALSPAARTAAAESGIRLGM